MAFNSLIRASQYPFYRRLVWGISLPKFRPAEALAINIILTLIANISSAIRLKF